MFQIQNSLNEQYKKELTVFMERCKEENKLKKKRSADIFRRNFFQLLNYIAKIQDNNQKYEVEILCGLFNYSNDTIIVCSKRLAGNFGMCVSFINHELTNLGYLKVDKMEKEKIIRKALKDYSMLRIWTVRRIDSNKKGSVYNLIVSN